MYCIALHCIVSLSTMLLSSCYTFDSCCDIRVVTSLKARRADREPASLLENNTSRLIAAQNEPVNSKNSLAA